MRLYYYLIILIKNSWIYTTQQTTKTRTTHERDNMTVRHAGHAGVRLGAFSGAAMSAAARASPPLCAVMSSLSAPLQKTKQQHHHQQQGRRQHATWQLRDTQTTRRKEMKKGYPVLLEKIIFAFRKFYSVPQNVI